MGVPGPAKSSSVWRWSMSQGERCRSRRACTSARPTWPAPAPPTSRRSRRALAPRASPIRLGDRLGALAVDAWAAPGLSLIRPPARSETDGGRFGFQQARQPQLVRGPPCPAFAIRLATGLVPPRASGGRQSEWTGSKASSLRLLAHAKRSLMNRDALGSAQSTPLAEDCSSRFSPVHRVDFEGQQRADNGSRPKVRFRGDNGRRSKGMNAPNGGLL